MRGAVCASQEDYFHHEYPSTKLKRCINPWIAITQACARDMHGLQHSDLVIYRLWLQELQACINIGVLETLLWDVIQQQDEVLQQRLDLEQSNREEAEPDSVISRWMERPDQIEKTKD
jgi:hypothetical protein